MPAHPAPGCPDPAAILQRFFARFRRFALNERASGLRARVAERLRDVGARGQLLKWLQLQEKGCEPAEALVVRSEDDLRRPPDVGGAARVSIPRSALLARLRAGLEGTAPADPRWVDTLLDFGLSASLMCVNAATRACYYREVVADLVPERRRGDVVATVAVPLGAGTVGAVLACDDTVTLWSAFLDPRGRVATEDLVLGIRSWMARRVGGSATRDAGPPGPESAAAFVVACFFPVDGVFLDDRALPLAPPKRAGALGDRERLRPGIEGAFEKLLAIDEEAFRLSLRLELLAVRVRQVDPLASRSRGAGGSEAVAADWTQPGVLARETLAGEEALADPVGFLFCLQLDRGPEGPRALLAVRNRRVAARLRQLFETACLFPARWAPALIRELQARSASKSPERDPLRPFSLDLAGDRGAPGGPELTRLAERAYGRLGSVDLFVPLHAAPAPGGKRSPQILVGYIGLGIARESADAGRIAQVLESVARLLAGPARALGQLLAEVHRRIITGSESGGPDLERLKYLLDLRLVVCEAAVSRIVGAIAGRAAGEWPQIHLAEFAAGLAAIEARNGEEKAGLERAVRAVGDAVGALIGGATPSPLGTARLLHGSIWSLTPGFSIEEASAFAAPAGAGAVEVSTLDEAFLQDPGLPSLLRLLVETYGAVGNEAEIALTDRYQHPTLPGKRFIVPPVRLAQGGRSVRLGIDSRGSGRRASPRVVTRLGVGEWGVEATWRSQDFIEPVAFEMADGRVATSSIAGVAASVAVLDGVKLGDDAPVRALTEAEAGALDGVPEIAELVRLFAGPSGDGSSRVRFWLGRAAGQPPDAPSTTSPDGYLLACGFAADPDTERLREAHLTRFLTAHRIAAQARAVERAASVQRERHAVEQAELQTWRLLARNIAHNLAGPLTVAKRHFEDEVRRRIADIPPHLRPAIQDAAVSLHILHSICDATRRHWRRHSGGLGGPTEHRVVGATTDILGLARELVNHPISTSFRNKLGVSLALQTHGAGTDAGGHPREIHGPRDEWTITLYTLLQNACVYAALSGVLQAVVDLEFEFDHGLLRPDEERWLEIRVINSSPVMSAGRLAKMTDCLAGKSSHMEPDPARPDDSTGVGLGFVGSLLAREGTEHVTTAVRQDRGRVTVSLRVKLHA